MCLNIYLYIPLLLNSFSILFVPMNEFCRFFFLIFKYHWTVSYSCGGFRKVYVAIISAERIFDLPSIWYANCIYSIKGKAWGGGERGRAGDKSTFDWTQLGFKPRPRIPPWPEIYTNDFPSTFVAHQPMNNTDLWLAFGGAKKVSDIKHSYHLNHKGKRAAGRNHKEKTEGRVPSHV